MPDQQERARKTAHTHEYVRHPEWPTHYVCRICGFAAPRDLIDKMHGNLVHKEEIHV